jgi:hypothetical protein
LNWGTRTKLKSFAQTSGANSIEQIVEELEMSPLSPTTLNFVASGGVQDNVNLSGSVPHGVAASSVPEVIPLSPFHGFALSLYNNIHHVVILSLDLNLDLVIPPYLSLPTVIGFLKLIKDGECLIQATSQKVLLECLETLEDVEAHGREEEMVQPV